MKRHSTLLVICVSLALSLALGSTGCEEDPGPPFVVEPPGIPERPRPAPPLGLLELSVEQLFAKEVAPTLAATCGSAGCHDAGGQEPGFVGESAAASRELIESFHDQLVPGYSTATLLTYGGDGSHHGARFTARQALAVQYWLALEAASKLESSAPSAMAIWSGCLDVQQFVASGVADAWAKKKAGDFSCSVCHRAGAHGFIVDDDDARLFDAIARRPRLMISYFTVDATGEIVINTARFERVGQQQRPNVSHPRFDIDGEAMNRLQSFYEQTRERLAAGICLPPRFGF